MLFRAIFNFLLGLVSGPVLDGYRAKLASQNDANQIGAGLLTKQLDAEIAARGDARTIRLATAGHWEMRLLTFIIAGCFALHLVLVTADTCFQLGLRVPKYPAPFDQWEGAILLSFFGVQAMNKVASTAALWIMGARK